jgi:HNH endonuclease
MVKHSAGTTISFCATSWLIVTGGSTPTDLQPKLLMKHFKRRHIEWSDDWYIPEPNSGCHIWLGPLTRTGYGSAATTSAHRYAWKHFRGEIPQGMCVLHRCDVRCCVNPDHLFLDTQLKNIADRVAKGRNGVARGERHGRWRGGMTPERKKRKRRYF